MKVSGIPYKCKTPQHTIVYWIKFVMAYDQERGINIGTCYGFIDDAVGLYF